MAIPGYAYIGVAAGVWSMEMVSAVLNITVLKRNLHMIKAIPSALLDVFVVVGIITVLARIKPDSLASLTSFVMSSIFFFSLTGIYMVLRCKKRNSLS
ncbi:hypothetical protein D3C81_2092420 [compost metagenome]